jgi:hypothetical protein
LNLLLNAAQAIPEGNRVPRGAPVDSSIGPVRVEAVGGAALPMA